MTPDEAATLLAMAAAFDMRTVGEYQSIAWAHALADLPFKECADAMAEHFGDPATCEKFLLPGMIRARVTSRRKAAAGVKRNTAALRELEAAKADALPPEQAAQRAREVRQLIAAATERVTERTDNA